MTRLILHVGTHKTATTTIQQHLSANREELEARGIWYPNYDIIGGRNHYAHLGMANALTGNHDKYSPEDAKSFFRTVAQRALNYDVTILSAEPFYRHIAYDATNQIPKEPVKYWHLRSVYTEKVRELFGDIPAEVVLVFREQSAYAQSLYQEHVKVTRYTRSFRDFLEDFWFHFAYLNQARTWAHTFDDISILTFDQIVSGGRPALNFGSALGIDLTGEIEVPASNTSLHTDMVILKRMIQGSSLSRKEIRKRIEKVAEGPLKDHLSALGKRSFFGSAEAAHAFHNKYVEDNHALRDEFRPDLPAPLFSQPKLDRVLFGDKLHPYTINEILKLIPQI